MSGSLRVLLAGGSGLVGRAVRSKLCAASHAVTVLSRANDAGAADVMTWNELNDGAASEGRFDVVINACGSRFLDPLVPWNDKTRDEIRTSRVGTAKALSELAAADKGIKRMVQITGVGAYPYSQSELYTEKSEVTRNDTDFFQSLVCDWEAAARAGHDKTTVIRSGVVLAKDGGAFKEQLLLYKLGMGAPMGSGGQPFPWIHIDDLATLIVHAAGGDGSAADQDHEQRPRLFNGVAPSAEGDTAQDFTDHFKRALGRPLWFPPVNVPGFVARGLFGGADRADFLLKGMRVRPEAAMQSGFEFRFATLAAALDDLCKA